MDGGWTSPPRVDTRIRDIYPGNESRSGSGLFFFFFFFLPLLSVRSRIQIFCEHTRYAAAVLRFKTPDMRFNVGFNRAPSATIRILEAYLPGPNRSPTDLNPAPLSHVSKPCADLSLSLSLSLSLCLLQIMN